MARVTKINVGGTNYDIAHEGELKKSGFEVVTELPTTELFAGREVMYNGKKYVYSSGWKEEITANTMYEANLLWGGRNISDGYSTIDSAMVSELSTNVMAFPKPASISVEYSRDGGVTWIDYGATDQQKVDIFTRKGVTHLYCGKTTNGEAATVGYQLKITIDAVNAYLYSFVNKVILYSSDNGSYNCWVTIKGLRLPDFQAGNLSEDFFETIVDKVHISGWPGFNVINFADILTSPSKTTTSYQTSFILLSLTFGYDSTFPNITYNGLGIGWISLYGKGRYKTPSNLAKNNHLYTYDWQQNAFFPAKVESKEIINFDVNNIEPTQTGSSVSKTSTWLWQYLTQAINWLKANNVRLSAYNTKVAALEQADSDNDASVQSVRTDLTELSNGLATVATSGSYNDLTDKPTFSGSYNDLTDKPTLFSGSYNDLTDKPTLATVATSGSYNDLTDKPSFSGSYNDLTDKPTLFSGSYNDLTDKPTLATVATSGSYNDLTDKPDLVFSNIGGNVATAQITDGSITNAKLTNSSMSLNGITVNLGDTAILPWYVDYNEVDYPARIRDHWLQIYRNGVWANLMYLGDILPTQVGQITSLDNLDWYNEQVSEYEVDSNTTTSILNGTTLPATVLMNCLAEQLTLNFYPINGKQYGKGSLDNLITDLQDKGFSVFVENDLDAIQQSGSDYLVRLKISKVPTPKAIIECYVAR